MMPFLPLLWFVSTDFWYLIGVQVISGVAWGGFSLSTANYLYDIRPHKTSFAAYAAVQSWLGATLVFVGSLFGGVLAELAPKAITWLPDGVTLYSPLLLVFAASGLLRAWVVIWFVPRAVEPRFRQRPQLLQIIFRVARFNPVSGMVLDWLTVTRSKPDDAGSQRVASSEKSPCADD
jgi:MFS family permease